MLNCVHCSRHITKDAAKGGWPLGPVGPVCMRDPAIAKHLAAQRKAQRVARQPIGATRAKVRRPVVAAEVHADPRQMALELEAAC